MHEFKGSRVKIMVTSRCTATCRHCCLNFSGTRELDELNAMIASLYGSYDLRLDGSEMLINDEYIRIMKQVGQDNVMTNGKLILRDSQHCISILKENGIRDIYFSYHYGIQDELTDISLEDVEKAIRIVQDANFRTGLMCTVTKKNVHMIEEICQKAVSLGAFYIQFNPIMLQGSARKNMQADALSEDERRQLCQELRILYKKYLLELTIDAGKATEISLSDDFVCRAVERKVWIGVDNKVYPCVFLIEPGMEIGVYQDGKVWIEDDIAWGGKRCAAYIICNEHKSLWKRGGSADNRVDVQKL